MDINFRTLSHPGEHLLLLIVLSFQTFVRLQVKGKMGGFTITIAYAFMFGAVKIFPYLLSLYSMEIMFYLFALSSSAFCIFVYNFLPETYGKNLVDIQNYFVKPA